MMLPHHHLLHPSPPPPQAQQRHVAPLALRLPPPPETRKPNTTLSNLSRRDLAIATFSLPLLWALPATPQDLEESPPVDINDERTVGKKAFLDISIDGAPAGRVTVGLYTADAPAGASRFLGLITGSTGVSYRRKEFVKILPNYVQHGGVRSYGVDVELAASSGSELATEGL